MKTKDDRYREAVERTLRGMEDKAKNMSQTGGELWGVAFWYARTMLGIRKYDTQYDERVAKLIGSEGA